MLWKIYARYREIGEDYAKDCYQAGIIAVGWGEIGSLERVKDEDLRQRLIDEYGYSIAKAGAVAGNLRRFYRDVREKRDYVICSDKQAHRFYIGRVDGPYFFSRRKFGGNKDCSFEHRRKVMWQKALLHEEVRAVFGRLPTTRQTVLPVKEREAKALMRLVRETPPPPPPPPPRTRHGGGLPEPDPEFGRKVELRALQLLKQEAARKGMPEPEHVAHLNKGWDIQCADNLYEVKGRKASTTKICLTENEYYCARRYRKRYYLLVFTTSPRKLRHALPVTYIDPAGTITWEPRKVTQYWWLP